MPKRKSLPPKAEPPKNTITQGFAALFAKRKKPVGTPDVTIDLTEECSNDAKPLSVISINAQESLSDRQRTPSADDPEAMEVDLPLTPQKNNSAVVNITEESNDGSQLGFSTSALSEVFHEILTIMKASEAKWLLLSPESQEAMEKLSSCSGTAIDEALRWYARTAGWRNRLKKSDDVDFKSLVEKTVVEVIGQTTKIKFKPLLEIMNKDELGSLATTMMLDKKHKKNMQTIKKKLLENYKNGTKPSLLGGMTHADRLELCAKKKIDGHRYKLSDDFYTGLNMLFLAYSPSICQIDQAPNTVGTRQNYVETTTSLGQTLVQKLARFGSKKSLLGTTLPSHDAGIICSRDDILALQDAMMAKYKVELLVETKKFKEANDACFLANHHFREYKKNFPESHEIHLKLPSFQFRFSTTGVYTSILRYHIDILERLKDYGNAKILLLKLLKKSSCCQHRRGRWWIRLVLNQAHLGDEKSDIVKNLEKALSDKAINDVTKAELQERLEKFLKKGAIEGRKLEGWPVVKETAQRLSRKTDNPNHAKKWVTEVDGEEYIESVEHVALRKLKANHGFDCGEHAEGNLFSTILSLAFYDEIIADVEGTYLTRFQNGPLDFFTDEFYKSRQAAIDAKLDDLEEDGFDTILEKMKSVYEQITDRSEIIGIHHTPEFFEWSKIESLCRCLGGDALSAILRRILRSSSYRSGMPDLVAWKSPGEASQYCLCEVKAPNDSLSFAQKCWLKFFIDNKINCELMHIAEA